MQCLHFPKDCSFMLKSGECENNISVTQTGYGDKATCNRYCKGSVLSKCCGAGVVLIGGAFRCKCCAKHINPKDGTVTGAAPRDMALLMARGPDSDGKGGQPVEGDVESPSPAPETLESNDRLLEMLAALEHDQWIEWSKSIANDPRENISIDRLARWKKFWVPYEKLPEENKISDRNYAKKVMKLIWPYIKGNLKWFDMQIDSYPTPPPKPEAIWLEYGTCLSCMAARSHFRPPGIPTCPSECHYIPDKEDCPEDCNKELPTTPADTAGDKDYCELCDGPCKYPDDSYHIAEKIMLKNIKETRDKGETWPCGCVRAPGSPVIVRCGKHFKDDTEPESREKKE